MILAESRYYLDVDLGLGPVDALALQGTLNLAPIFKPVMGLITDNLPLCGSHRRHYFCMAAAMGSLCYGLLFFLPASVVITAQGENNRIWIATLLLFFANFFGYSWSGVVLYSMTAEKARLDPVAGAANLNTLQWGWFAFGNLVADANVAWLYNTFGAQNCWLLSCVCFGIMAAMAFLYDDEVSIMKEFEGGCASQMRKLGECLNPFGVTRGTILRCIVFIFLTWAMTPDLFYGTTYYFYTASPCGPDGCCTAALTVDHNSCGRSESGGGCRCGGTARFPRPFDDTSNECDHDNFQGFAEYACQQGGDIDAGIPGEPQLQGSGREQCEATIAHGRGNGTGLAGICGPPGRYNGTGLPMYCRSIYNGRCYGQCGDPTISCWSLTTQESCEGNRRPEAGGGTWTNGCVRSVVGGVPEPAICETLTEDECNDSVDGGGSGGRWTPTTLEPWKPCCYYTEPTHGGLGFDAQFWAIIAILGDLAMMLASWAYGAFLTKSPLRPLFVLLQLLNTVAAVPDLILTLGLHDSLGIPAQVFAPIGIAAFWFAWQLKVLPVYTLAARICPSGVEATLMALISATNDVGGTVARYLGAFLTSILGITDVDFGNAWLLFLLRIVLTALPIIVVPLVPSEDAINEVCALVDAQESVSVGNDGKVHSTPATTADTRLQESPGVPTRRASTAAADISSSLSEPLMSSPIGQSSAYD
jgi:MFS family permease